MKLAHCVRVRMSSFLVPAHLKLWLRKETESASTSVIRLLRVHPSFEYVIAGLCSGGACLDSWSSSLPLGVILGDGVCVRLSQECLLASLGVVGILVHAPWVFWHPFFENMKSMFRSRLESTTTLPLLSPCKVLIWQRGWEAGQVTA